MPLAELPLKPEDCSKIAIMYKVGGEKMLQACEAVKVNGGYVVSGAKKLYGVAVVAAGATALQVKARKASLTGAILLPVACAASSTAKEISPTPIATEGDVFVETTAPASEVTLYTDEHSSITGPSKNLICRVTKA